MTDQLITEKCRNFKKYLTDKFEVSDFGEFICASTFSLAELDNLRQQAGNENVTSFRLYYGCETDGSGHKLYLKLVPPANNLPIVKSMRGAGASAESLPLSDIMVNTEKCPPGDPCQNDTLINNL